MRLTADLLGSGRNVVLRLDSRSRYPITIIDADKTVIVDVKGRWKPWSIVTADLDGDGRREIVVALFKSTRYMPKPHNCLFVYRYDGRHVYPLWLGSSLGRPFTELAFCPSPDGKSDLLVSLDIRLDGRQGITVHRWTGFGFQAVQSWGNWTRAHGLSAGRGEVSVLADGNREVRSLKEN